MSLGIGKQTSRGSYFTILIKYAKKLWCIIKSWKDGRNWPRPTFCKRDHNQGSVHEDCVGQVLRDSHRLRLKELYKTDTWSHRQGRVTGKKHRYVVQEIQTRGHTLPSSLWAGLILDSRNNWYVDQTKAHFLRNDKSRSKDNSILGFHLGGLGNWLLWRPLELVQWLNKSFWINSI